MIIKDQTRTSAKKAQDQTSQDWEKEFYLMFERKPNKDRFLELVYPSFVKDWISSLLAKEKETAKREERDSILKIAKRNSSFDEYGHLVVTFKYLEEALTHPSESYQSRLNEHNSNSAGSEKKA